MWTSCPYRPELSAAQPEPSATMSSLSMNWRTSTASGTASVSNSAKATPHFWRARSGSPHQARSGTRRPHPYRCRRRAGPRRGRPARRSQRRLRRSRVPARPPRAGGVPPPRAGPSFDRRLPVRATHRPSQRVADLYVQRQGLLVVADRLGEQLQAGASEAEVVNATASPDGCRSRG
jgi:hypothetical protein